MPVHKFKTLAISTGALQNPGTTAAIYTCPVNVRTILKSIVGTYRGNAAGNTISVEIKRGAVIIPIIRTFTNAGLAAHSVAGPNSGGDNSVNITTTAASTNFNNAVLEAGDTIQLTYTAVGLNNSWNIWVSGIEYNEL